jgi:hypothetical protein
VLGGFGECCNAMHVIGVKLRYKRGLPTSHHGLFNVFKISIFCVGEDGTNNGWRRR